MLCFRGTFGKGKAAEFRLKLNTAALAPTAPACGDLGRENSLMEIASTGH